MKQFESEHYIFHFNEGSKAEKDIEYISAISEIFRKTGKELNDEFVDYVGLFKIDERIFQPYKK